ncbi:glycerol kinase 2 [Capsulimonas corticalis]|uniref:Glycerol kinase n=1 Tax=Capsulimonas corticalis TaxID=2219043 RepID=A0A402CU34_9BACT|nr:glycerol kinase GlpK [Capsulimonas corticalis]BDI28842.1 glycerol kinase 2 [Capsulimonas corticalis]
MTEKYILALDQGTTSSRAIIFDHAGRALCQRSQEFRQIYPKPGWVEHNAEDIWSSQLNVGVQVLQDQGLTMSDIAAVGITNQRETTIVWDRRTGAPIHNAIVWQDRRTAGYCDELKRAGWEEKIRAKTGLVIDAYFSGSKVKWLLDNVPGAREKAERGELMFGTVDTFLVWRLSAGAAHVTDFSNASRTMLFNIHTLEWDDEILTEMGIPRSMLPEVRQSSEIYAEIQGRLRGANGTAPIAGIAGDQQAATFGQACFDVGQAKNTYGTGCFLLMNTGNKPVESKNNLLTTIGWGLNGKITYCLEGSVFVAGAAVQYLRDSLGIVGAAGETEALAASVASSGGVYFVPAFVGLGAPYWDQYARGAIMGLTRGSGRAEIVRATLEAVAYQSRDLLEAMTADSGVTLSELRVDGGMVANNFLMQFQSDLLGVAVERPRVAETTALGAAYLAGLAVGYWKNIDEIKSNWALDKRFDPAMDKAHRDKAYAGWKRAVERVRAWEEPDESFG